MISLHNVEKIANFYSVAFRMIASNTKDFHRNFNIETFQTRKQEHGLIKLQCFDINGKCKSLTDGWTKLLQHKLRYIYRRALKSQ